jgi:hypothetical protein
MQKSGKKCKVGEVIRKIEISKNVKNVKMPNSRKMRLKMQKPGTD